MTTAHVTTTTGSTGARIEPRALTWVGGGLLWSAAGLVGLGAEEGSGRFTGSIALWLVAQLVLLVGLGALRAAAPWGGRRTGRVGLAIALVGRLAFVAAEAVTLATGELAEAIYPLGALLTAIGMTVLGTAVLREHGWEGPSRFAPLAAGIFPFVAMFPIVAAGGTPDVPIALWGLLLAAVGLGRARPAATGRSRSLRTGRADERRGRTRLGPKVSVVALGLARRDAGPLRR